MAEVHLADCGKQVIPGNRPELERAALTSRRVNHGFPLLLGQRREQLDQRFQRLCHQFRGGLRLRH